jgi:DNA polymerase-1
VFGRRLYLPDIAPRTALRQAPSARRSTRRCRAPRPTIIKLAMVAVHNWLERQRAGCRVILQVHDELVLEVRGDLVEQVKDEIRGYMSRRRRAGGAAAGGSGRRLELGRSSLNVGEAV